MTVVLLKSVTLGTVNQVANEAPQVGLEFGKTMMAKFLHNLESKAKDIDTIICYTEGVFNAVRGSDTALSLSFMQDSGVKILLCSTCLEHYHLEAAQVVGTVSDMATIVTTLVQADKVIKP